MRGIKLALAAGMLGLGASGSGAALAQGFLGSLFGQGGAPSAAEPQLPQITCPQVDVATGGAALATQGGRGQIALSNFARECTVQPDGSVVVKIGVQGRALLAAGGSAGRVEAPLRFVVKAGDTVLASRARRVPVAIPAGDTQGAFSVVEDGFVVPAKHAQDFEIEVGLGGGAAERRPARGPRQPG